MVQRILFAPLRLGERNPSKSRLTAGLQSARLSHRRWNSLHHCRSLKIQSEMRQTLTACASRACCCRWGMRSSSFGLRAKRSFQIRCRTRHSGIHTTPLNMHSIKISPVGCAPAWKGYTCAKNRFPRNRIFGNTQDLIESRIKPPITEKLGF